MSHPPAPVTHHWDGKLWTCACCDGRSDGVLVVSTPAAAIGLLLRDGVVVGPKHRRGWLGREVNRPLAAGAWRRQPDLATRPVRVAVGAG